VLLIIFMVSAPLLTVGVPLDLPQTQAKSLEQDKTPLQLCVDVRGKVFINDTEVRWPTGTEIKGHYRRPRAARTSVYICGGTKRPIMAPWRE